MVTVERWLVSERTPLYLSDFMTGLLAALAQKHIQSLSLRKTHLDRAFAETFRDLEEEAKKSDLLVRFRIRTHPLHHDSPAILQALYDAAKRDLISLDNPEFQDVRLKIAANEASAYFRSLPGDEAMYVRLAEAFLRHYRELSTAPAAPAAAVAAPAARA